MLKKAKTVAATVAGDPSPLRRNPRMHVHLTISPSGHRFTFLASDVSWGSARLLSIRSDTTSGIS